MVYGKLVHMEYQHCNLNIWYHLPEEVWDKVPLVYEKMDGWLGFGTEERGEEGIPYWYNFDESKKSISASVEPSGLQFTAMMDANKWEEWITDFKKQATIILGFKVGDIEVGEVGYDIEWIR